MENRAFLEDDRTAVFKCPQCNLVKSMDVGQYSKLDRFIRFTARCVCGHSFKVVLERRKFYRKKVKLAGKCSLKSGSRDFSIVVKDLSRQGLGFEVFGRTPFKVGDLLMVEFKLDNDSQTVIRKEVKVQLITGETVGAAFYSMDPQNVYDKELGFYLL
ncbi:PilZ domain-containing protein [Desulfococcus sp.]|uniref:PilZ domain-containing protein n=1 Tax=Desulfococcus sp. TaxID=2025834 RepID=UPI003593BE93